MCGGDPAASMFDRFLELFKTESIGPRRFIDAILGKEKVETSFYDGWKVQLVIDAALESHRTGKFVKVEGN